MIPFCWQVIKVMRSDRVISTQSLIEITLTAFGMHSEWIRSAFGLYLPTTRPSWSQRDSLNILFFFHWVNSFSK